MRRTQVSEQEDRKTAPASEMTIKTEDNGSSDRLNLKSEWENDTFAEQHKNEIKQTFFLNSEHIRENNSIDFESVDAKRIKVEYNLPSEEELPKFSDIASTVFEVTEFETSAEIKVENDFESEDKSNIFNEKKYTTIPEVSHISVGEIKIEDDASNKGTTASEDEGSDIESDEDNGSVKIKYEVDSDDDMSSGEENSSAVSKWNEEDDLPTTSRNTNKGKRNLKSKKGKNLKIKEETKGDSDSEQDDMDIPSDDDEEFISDASAGEEILSDGDENSSDNQNLNVDNKPIVSQLIDEYHKRPQLWFKELSSEVSDVNELQLFRSINNALRKKLNMNFNVNGIKTLLESLLKQYETEIERQLKENEETTAESSSLWFYDKLFFLKDDIEAKVKLKVQKTLKVLYSSLAPKLRPDGKKN